MIRIIATRIAETALVLVVVSVMVFLLVRLAPGDPVDIFLGEQEVSAEQREALIRSYGLDRPLAMQYLRFAGNALTGDLGQSIVQRTDVAGLIWPALMATVELTVAGLLISVIVGVPAALLAAMMRGRWADQLSSGFALFAFSMPTFWLGVMLVLLFSVWLGWLPTGGRIDRSVGLVPITGLYSLDAVLSGNLPALHSALRYLTLPAIAIAAALTAALMQVLRGSLISVSQEDFINALRARGLGKRQIWGHMLRNAAPPTVIIMGVKFGGLLGGAIVTESVFSWPGLGLLIVEAIRARDYPLVQGGVLTMAAAFVVVSLIVDIIHLMLDPRIRQGGGH